jgi:hypothetical protein
MHVVVAKFECIFPEGLPSARRKKLLFGLLTSLRTRLKCSVESIEAPSGATNHDFAIGISYVVEREGQDGAENKLSEEVVDIIQRKGEFEVQDYLCTIINFDDIVDQEDLITVH